MRPVAWLQDESVRDEVRSLTFGPLIASRASSAEVVARGRYAGPMSFLEAAETVLRSAKKPLTASEITEIALRRGLLQTRGKTPAATMSAALYGAPPGGPIRRQYTPGRQRAVRDSVRWTYDKQA